MEKAPRIYLCATTQDTELVELLSARLRSRGLDLSLGGELGELASVDLRQEVIAHSDLALIVVSQASARSSVVTADYQYALARRKTLIPLIAEPLKRLPPELRETQASDFSRSEAAGWASLLTTLDALGMARYPAPAIPELDAELAIARARTGLIPPGWTVTRMRAPGPRRLAPPILLGLIFALPVLIGGYFLAGRDPLILAFGSLLLVPLCLRSFQPTGIRLRKDEGMVVLAPDGIAVQTKTGITWASFHEVTDLASAGAAPTTTTLRLVGRSDRGSRTVSLPMSALLPGGLGQQGLALYLAWAARYRSDALRTRLQESPPPPIIFVSYARTDAEIVDRLELALQEAGFAPWVDRSGLISGQVWSAQINQALERCAAVVVVITRASMRSEEVRKEYTSALAAGKPVVGLLVQQTHRIPLVIRSRTVADARPALGLAMLDLALALDNAGVHPVSGYASPGAYRMARDPNLALARALHEGAPPQGRLYRGGFPFALIFAAVAVLLTVLLFLGMYLSGGPPFFLIISGATLAVAAPAFISALRRRLRYPDVVLTLPDGFITFLDSSQIHTYPYASARALTVDGARLLNRVRVIITGYSGASYHQNLPATLPQRAIAERIAEDFAAFQATRPAP
jgi:hypothetical protein